MKPYVILNFGVFSRCLSSPSPWPWWPCLSRLAWTWTTTGCPTSPCTARDTSLRMRTPAGLSVLRILLCMWYRLYIVVCVVQSVYCFICGAVCILFYVWCSLYIVVYLVQSVHFCICGTVCSLLLKWCSFTLLYMSYSLYIVVYVVSFDRRCIRIHPYFHKGYKGYLEVEVITC